MLILYQWFSTVFWPVDHLFEKNPTDHFAMLTPYIIYCTVEVTAFRTFYERFMELSVDH